MAKWVDAHKLLDTWSENYKHVEETKFKDNVNEDLPPYTRTCRVCDKTFKTMKELKHTCSTSCTNKEYYKKEKPT